MKKKASILILIIIAFGIVGMVEAKPTKVIEKGVFIHRVKPEKPDRPPKPNGGGKEWYKYSGIHWATTNVEYYINLEGSNLDDDDAFQVLVDSFETWDVESDTTEIFGEAQVGAFEAGIDDGFNTISFGILEPGIIAVTYYSYYVATGELIEVDTKFNTYYQWSLIGESGKMDLQNIATHEFGHWLLLGDLYNKPANEQTMYGYSSTGETIKQDLESGDIAGVEAIYGP